MGGKTPLKKGKGRIFYKYFWESVNYRYIIYVKFLRDGNESPSG
jgi:hypothetical protein